MVYKLSVLPIVAHSAPLIARLGAASAGYQVGYDNASQFNREYKRLFGLQPMGDVERLRAGPRESMGAD